MGKINPIKGRLMFEPNSPAKLMIRMGVYLAFVIGCVIVLFPLIWTFSTSIKKPLDALSIPPVWFFKPTTKNYADLFMKTENFGQYVINSVAVCVISTVVVSLVGCLAAYAFARFHFMGKDSLGVFILAARMIPPIVIVVPLFLMFRNLGLLDTKFALILANLSFNTPFAIWLMRGFIESLPPELEECAMIDGCGRIQAFFRITLPLTLPGITATAIIVMIVTWNEFLFPLILTSREARTLPVVAAGFVEKYGVNWAQLSAISMVMFLPLIAIAGYIQKYFIRGLAQGAVKG